MTSEAMSIVVDVNGVIDVVAQDANLSGSSSTHDENIYERLKKVAQVEDIERLYELVAEDPNILDHYDKVPFYETPLHIAAEKGQTHFAMELMTLKPSLALKLNVSGFSPMHLALQNNHIRVVRGLVAINSSLVSIKGRGSITPLHHVAQIGDVELLSEFLFASPSSINDLTIKCETVVHVAVKSHQFMAFKVLLGWIKRVNREEILDWKDEDGNTVFHIAALINQTEVMKLLRKTVKVKAKNLDGKTAMDILQTHQSPCFPEARRFFHNAKERLLCGSTTTLAEYLSRKLSFMERRNNFLGLSNLSITRDVSLNTSDHRSAILVVAILIVSATYQTSLSPPGGFWQDNSKPGDKNYHLAGDMIMPISSAYFFLILNGFAFLLSLYVIIIIIIGLPKWKLIYGSTAALSIAILASYSTIFPNDYRNEYIAAAIFFYAYSLIIGTMMFATYMTFIVDKRRRLRVDFPARCFSSSQE